MESYKGINFKRTKDCNKIEYIKHNADGSTQYISPAKFGNIDITEFRNGQEGGDFNSIELTLKDVDKFKSIFQEGEFLEIIPQYSDDEEFHEMCRFYAGYDKDSDLIGEKCNPSELLTSDDMLYAVKGGAWCYQF